MKTIALVVMSAVAAAASLPVLSANRVLRTDFWMHRPGATALPPPKHAA